MKYFSELPQALYPRIENDETQQYVALTNILTRSAFVQEIIDNVGMYYEYNVKEDETPEIIAHKLYGSVDRFWIVLLFNNFHNPYYDFPLNSSQLDNLIEDKYGYDVPTAQATVHHYERKVTHTVRVNGATSNTSYDSVTISPYEQDPDTGLVVLNPYLPGSPDTSNEYLTTTETVDVGTDVVTTYEIKSVSVYTYELNENEKRRSIMLLDEKYVPMVENEYKRLMET